MTDINLHLPRVTLMSETRELKDHGLKATFPRRKILELMESSEVRHFSAEDIYRMLLNNDFEIGLATVYRVLTQFEAAGMIVKHHFEEGHSVFELSSDLHHDHIVCVRCGKVEEFHDDEIESRQRDIAARMGFELTDHNLNLYGLCPTCQTSAN